MADRTTVLIVLTLLSTAAFAAVIVFASLDNIPNNGIFNNTIQNVSRTYPTEITPADYAFIIWGLIYLMQAAWLGYALSAICRTNSHGLVMMNPVVLPESFHRYWIISCVGTVVWLFAWDKELLLLSAVVLLVLTLSGYAASYVNGNATLQNEDMLENEMYADLICIRVLIQNGVDLFFAWTTVATLINFSAALTYDPSFNTNLSSEASSILCLAVLGVTMVVWSFAENTRYFDLFKYVYAWYFVLIWALTAIIVKNPDPSNTVTAITISLLCVAIVCLGLKITIFVTSPAKKTAKYRQFGAKAFKM